MSMESGDFEVEYVEYEYEIGGEIEEDEEEDDEDDEFNDGEDDENEEGDEIDDEDEELDGDDETVTDSNVSSKMPGLEVRVPKESGEFKAEYIEYEYETGGETEKEEDERFESSDTSPQISILGDEEESRNPDKIIQYAAIAVIVVVIGFFVWKYAPLIN